MEEKPDKLIIPASLFEEDPNIFETACEICGIDPAKTELIIPL